MTFFSAIQYIFLSTVPSTVTHFAFLCITSTIGFILIFLVFINELFRIDKRHIIQSALLSVLTFTYSIFLLLGSHKLDSTTISSVVSSYFIFIPVVELIAFKTKPKKSVIVAILFVMVGIFLIMDLKLERLLNINILFLIVTDIFIAIYIVSTGAFASGSNPAILAMGQLFFTAIISFIFWFADSRIKGYMIALPPEPAFWGSVIYMSIFIRGLYTVIQTYAQRFVTPLNTSLIFSTEVIITLLLTPLISRVFHMQSSDSVLSVTKCIGVVVMLTGIIISDPSILKQFTFKKRNISTNV